MRDIVLTGQPKPGKHVRLSAYERWRAFDDLFRWVETNRRTIEGRRVERLLRLVAEVERLKRRTKGYPVLHGGFQVGGGGLIANIGRQNFARFQELAGKIQRYIARFYYAPVLGLALVGGYEVRWRPAGDRRGSVELSLETISTEADAVRLVVLILEKRLAGNIVACKGCRRLFLKYRKKEYHNKACGRQHNTSGEAAKEKLRVYQRFYRRYSELMPWSEYWAAYQQGEEPGRERAWSAADVLEKKRKRRKRA